MKKVRNLIISFIAALGLVTVTVPMLAFADSCSSPTDCLQQGADGVTDKGGSNGDLKKAIQTVVNIMLFVLGAIAVIMIIIGGIRYTTSNGDANSTKAAKDTILYAVIGLVVAILAYAIVNFVISSFK